MLLFLLNFGVKNKFLFIKTNVFVKNLIQLHNKSWYLYIVPLYNQSQIKKSFYFAGTTMKLLLSLALLVVLAQAKPQGSETAPAEAAPAPASAATKQVEPRIWLKSSVDL